MQRFRGGLVFKAHRLVHHSTLGWRIIKKKKVPEHGTEEFILEMLIVAELDAVFQLVPSLGCQAGSQLMGSRRTERVVSRFTNS